MPQDGILDVYLILMYLCCSSTIRFRPTSSDNGVTYACEAEHPALLNTPLRSTVSLSVLRKFKNLSESVFKIA